MKHDCLVLGSSPNALVAARYLVLQGWRVLVLEPRSDLGGPARLLPSLRLDAQVVRELDLDYRPETQTVQPLEECSPRNPGLEGLLEQAAGLLRRAWEAADSSLLQAWRDLGQSQAMEVLRLPWMSLRDLLGEWLEGEAERGFWAGLGLRGLGQGPYASGTVYPLLHQMACGEGLERCPSEAALAALAEGLEVRTGVSLVGIEVQEGRAVGVRIEDEVLKADFVLSDYDARHTLNCLVAPCQLPPEYNRLLRHYHCRGCVALLEVRLARPAWGTRLHCPGLTWLEKAYDPTKYQGVSPRPMLEVTARGERALVWAQYYPQGAPGPGDLSPLEGWLGPLQILRTWTAPDLAREFRLTGGHLYGGDNTLYQSFFLRPGPATPIDHLLLCGAAIHPGGYTGLSGRRAARALLSGSLEPV
ncbi:MAG TPA: FAD-dependent oxidoreductase [Candidatus Nitrosotenuis sp.]|jgi:phytoene dehydrogenase-like protein|nr:FAD-dependent oxidoreductase [Candidatus Nitrosotenuis sp.]